MKNDDNCNFLFNFGYTSTSDKNNYIKIGSNKSTNFETTIKH